MKGYTATKGWAWLGIKAAMPTRCMRYVHAATGRVSFKLKRWSDDGYEWASGDLSGRFATSEEACCRLALAAGMPIARGFLEYMQRSGKALEVAS